jgi:hypothetical protein
VAKASAIVIDPPGRELERAERPRWPSANSANLSRRFQSARRLKRPPEDHRRSVAVVREQSEPAPKVSLGIACPLCSARRTGSPARRASLDAGAKILDNRQKKPSLLSNKMKCRGRLWRADDVADSAAR